VSGGALDHPAMFISLNNLGSLVLDIQGSRLDAKFIRETGATDDYFTIIKSNSTPVVANMSFTLPADDSTNLGLVASDANGDPLTYITSSQPERGLLSSFNPASGAFTYTPAHGFSGVDSFTFRAHDGQTNSALATATFNVTPLPDANFNGVPDAWEQQYAISEVDGDEDADGASNGQEYFANTNPTNSGSALKIMSVNVDEEGHATILWQSVGGTRYRMTYSDANAGGGLTPSFDDIVRSIGEEMDSAAVGSASTQTFSDSLPVAPNGGRYFRIRVVQ
jgi:hypothetical protein